MILIILPQNNPLSLLATKPVVSAMLPYVLYSKFFKDICVFSPYTNTPNDYINNKLLTKKNYKKNCLLEIKKLLDNNVSIPVIEVHQDIILAGEIAKKFPFIKVCIVKHGDYFINRFKEKFSIFRLFYYKKYIKFLHYIYCNSNYVLNTLLKGYPKIKNKIFTIYNSYGHILEEVNKERNTEKKNQIIFAGKPVVHKGIVEFIQSLPEVLNKHNNYTAIIVGAFFSKKGKYQKVIKNLVESPKIKKLIDTNRIMFFKNLTPKEVFEKMLESKIAVVPTKTNEPFGLVCLEAHLAKCAVVSSGNGGLSEISSDYAVYLNSVSSLEISSKVDYLIQNENILKNLVNNGYEYTYKKFDPKYLVKILDEKRENIINGY